MPVKIEQIVNGGVASQKSLGMYHRLEPPHPTLPNSSWLM